MIYLLDIFKILIPIDLFEKSTTYLNKILCRHEMRFWDMRWVVNTDDESDPNYKKFNNKIWKNIFCQCEKCGSQKIMSMKVGEFGKWKAHRFEPTKNGIVEVEILQYGPETKKQKRDRLINKIFINEKI